MDIKLVPDKYKDESTSKRSNKTGKKSFLTNFSFWLKLSVIFSVLAALTAGGLFGYKYYLNNQKEALEKQIIQLEDQRNEEMEENLISLYEKSQILKQLMDDHIYSSRAFNMLEELVIPKVQITSVEFDLEEAALNVGVTGEDYNSLAGQLVTLQRDSRVKQVDLNKAKIKDERETVTNLEIFINTEFLKGSSN